MKFKKIDRLLDLNRLSDYCGFFCGTDGLNNGYGCSFPEDGEGYEKQELGCCFGFDCPIAREADLDDLKKFDKQLYDEWKDSEYGPIAGGSDWMVQYREAV